MSVGLKQTSHRFIAQTSASNEKYYKYSQFYTWLYTPRWASPRRPVWPAPAGTPCPLLSGRELQVDSALLRDTWGREASLQILKQCVFSSVRGCVHGCLCIPCEGSRCQHEIWDKNAVVQSRREMLLSWIKFILEGNSHCLAITNVDWSLLLFTVFC